MTRAGLLLFAEVIKEPILICAIHNDAQGTLEVFERTEIQFFELNF